MYRVSDGRSVSEPATIVISSAQKEEEKQEDSEEVAAAPAETVQPPEAAPPAPAPKKTIRARKLRIAAANGSYSVRSTEDLFIDWEELWSKANDLPYTSKVRVEVISDSLHGRLTRLDNSEYRYQPDRYFGGKEVINYRFRLGKLKSKVRQVRIDVKLGKPAPEIRLRKLARAYVPGETVILDAEPSRDEARDSLRFTWEQVSGVPVMLEPMNEEQSKVAFVVPSTFNTVADPGPAFRLKVDDRDGKKDERTIKVKTLSRRRSAVWGGLAGGGIADIPDCPAGDCPGALLPWPYPER